MSCPEKPTFTPLALVVADPGQLEAAGFVLCGEPAPAAGSFRTSAVLTEKAQCELIEGVGAYEERRAVMDYLCRIGYFDIAEDIGARRHLG